MQSFLSQVVFIDFMSPAASRGVTVPSNPHPSGRCCVVPNIPPVLWLNHTHINSVTHKFNPIFWNFFLVVRSLLPCLCAQHLH